MAAPTPSNFVNLASPSSPSASPPPAPSVEVVDLVSPPPPQPHLHHHHQLEPAAKFHSIAVNLLKQELKQEINTLNATLKAVLETKNREIEELRARNLRLENALQHATKYYNLNVDL